MVKFILLIIGAYLVYKYVLRSPKALPISQEPELFIDHEVVKKTHEKNK